MSSLHLIHSELLDPKSRYEKILAPNRIPVHPQVFDSEFAYTQGFIDEVLHCVPDSIQDDIISIDKLFPSKTGLIFSERGVTTKGGTEYFFTDFYHMAREERAIDVSWGSSNIALDPNKDGKRGGQRLEMSLIEPHPTPIAKLSEYSLARDSLRIPRWYIHNVGDSAFPVFLYFRNFAIVFNNHGLQTIGKE